eukprot:915978-Amphidinium_carterae.1
MAASCALPSDIAGGTCVHVKRPHRLFPVWSHPTGRATLVAVSTGHIHFCIALIYGPVHDADATQKIGQDLVEAIRVRDLQHVLLAGDINADVTELPFLEELLSFGWARLTDPQVPTCYHAGAETCIDVAFCSSHLLPVLQSVRVTDDLA